MEDYLVIGGGGFLGRSIVEMLLQRQESVSVFDVKQSFDDSRLKEFVIGDVTRFSDLRQACEGKSVVIHTASPPHGLDEHIYFKVNVEGTQNVIQACRDAGVEKLVYTSSASVVFNGNQLLDGDEQTPYCSQHMDAYNETKSIAEKAVIEANSQSLLTIALRPSGIFGPKDMQGSYTMVQAAKRGQWRYMIGNNENLFDMTFIDNVAYAHVLAADKLSASNGTAGEAFIITNDQPMFFWDFAKQLFDGLGYKKTHSVCISRNIGMLIGTALDWLAFLLSPIYTIHPTFTRFRVQMITTNRYFDISKAKNILGYKPIVSMDEAIRRTAVYWADK